jgi:hypothetical protein
MKVNGQFHALVASPLGGKKPPVPIRLDTDGHDCKKEKSLPLEKLTLAIQPTASHRMSSDKAIPPVIFKY